MLEYSTDYVLMNRFVMWRQVVVVQLASSLSDHTIREYGVVGYNHRQIPLIFLPDNGKQKHLTPQTMTVYPSEGFVIVVLVTRVVIHFMLFTLWSCSSSSHKNDKGKSLAVLTRQK